MVEDKLKSAISAIKEGENQIARKILIEVVREEPTNEKAWLWLATCVGTVNQKRDCLTKALSINPNNQNARKALAQLNAAPEPSLSELQGSSPNTFPTNKLVGSLGVASNLILQEEKNKSQNPILSNSGKSYSEVRTTNITKGTSIWFWIGIVILN